MAFREQMMECVRAAAKRYPSDIDKAVDVCFEKVRKLEGYDEFAATFVRDSLRLRIHGIRHTDNIRMKRESGDYGGPAKVVVAGSEVVESASKTARALNLYLYSVGGMVLGDMTGEQLVAAASTERELANGHLFNHALFGELGRIVPKDKSVRATVKHTKLKAIFMRLQKQTGVSVAA